jgi:hypothetical protein
MKAMAVPWVIQAFMVINMDSSINDPDFGLN